jgi:Xaa-Pro aminopeptidase
MKMKSAYISKDFYINNRKKLIGMLKPNSLVIINSNDEMPRNGDQNFMFRQNSDLLYLSGIDQEKTVLTLCPDHPNPKYREILFLLKTNKELEIWQGHKYTIEEASKISGIETIFWLDKFESILNDLILNSDFIYLNYNENPRYSNDVLYRDLRFANELIKKYPLHNYERIAPLITSMRVIKTSEEIELIKTGCNIVKKTFFRLLKFIKPEIYEYEIEAEIAHEFILNKAKSSSFYPIVASGKNACILHYIENNNKCNDGDLVLIDFGPEYGYYAADCTRTVPVNGKFTKRQRELYISVLDTMKYAKSLLKPGITINQYHKKVVEFVEKEHIKLGLYSVNDLKNQNPDEPMFFKYYMHGTSHFIGMDVHDVGSKDQILEPGMVVSCEPGIYIQEEGIGIRLENDILITENGNIDLMAEIPIEPDEIEGLMKK